MRDPIRRWELALVIDSPDGRPWRLPLPPLEAPLPRQWSAEVRLPEGLEAGVHEMTLVAFCRPCRLSTNIGGRLEVPEPWLRWVHVVSTLR